jgi:hypothetical protein
MCAAEGLEARTYNNVSEISYTCHHLDLFFKLVFFMTLSILFGCRRKLKNVNITKIFVFCNGGIRTEILKII